MTGKTKAKLAGAGVLVAVLLILFNPNCSLDAYDVRVVDKQVKKLSDGREVFMIFTKRPNGDERVFIDTDSKLFFKFDSADIYARMEVGKWYRVRTTGWRLKWFSKFENILRAKELEHPPPEASPS
jgi:hypothetical protein